jgi:Flp pilus assembly pilin Flp
MQAFMNKIRRAFGKSALMTDERGLSTVEYVILLALIAVMSIALWSKFGSAITTRIDGATKEVDGMSKPGEGTGSGDPG